jgi:hypothetical protein
MSSQVSIANRALAKLGDERILLLTDNIKSARTISGMYEEVLLAELRRYRWKFATKRAQIMALVATPSWGYSFEYPLPDDFVSLIQVNDFYVQSRDANQAAWSVEQGSILTNLPAPLKIRYTAKIDNAGFYDPLFVEAFACKLALECCETLTQSESKFQRVSEQYKFALSEAYRQDAIENPPDILPNGSWLDSRQDQNTGFIGSNGWQAYPSGL